MWAQQFNATTYIGRLTLNIRMSFAQFAGAQRGRQETTALFG
jgi:hypothetical protein